MADNSLQFRAELAFGEDAETDIVRRWAKASDRERKIGVVVKTPELAALDFLILDRQGVPAAFVEVKKRRTRLGQYGDVLCPISKHHVASTLHKRFRLPALLVTEYGCGSLVEVDLTKPPAGRRDVKRRDRPAMAPVPHALYSGDQLRVWPA